MNPPFQRILLVLGATLLWSASGGQAQLGEGATLAERLGYGPEARLLIVHADDLGVGNSVNQASFRALKAGRATSASLMVPCAWFPQVAAEAKKHPDWDLGIHLTMNAEWEQYKWGPVAPQGRVPSLIDPTGYLYATVQEAVQKIDPLEAEVEIRAQIERCRALGVEPTHLDSHMGTLFRTEPLLRALVKVARESRLPVLLPRNLMGMAPFAKGLLSKDDIVIDHLLSISPGIKSENWAATYDRILSELKPGVSQLIVHLGLDDPELQAITVNHPDFGSAWRQRDLDYVMSDGFSRLISREGIRLITWREIGRLLK